MGRWSNEKRAQEAAKAAEKASEAGRALQQLKQEAKPEPAVESEPKKPDRPADWRPPQRNDPRTKMLEEMEQKALERSGEAPPTPKSEVPDNPPPPTAEQMLEGGKFSDAAPPADSTPPQPATPVAEQVEAAPVEMLKVKVDHKEYEVPKSEVEEHGGLKQYQIFRAQQNRLDSMNEQLAEQRRHNALMVEMLQKQKPQEPALTDDQFIQSKVDTIRFGTPEESAAALKEIMAKGRVDPSAITAQAVAQVGIQAGRNAFKTEFPDIVAQPLILKLAAQLEFERLQPIQNDAVKLASVDWPAFYRTIGNEIRSVLPRPSQATATSQQGQQPTSQPDKEARKASIVNLPTAAGRASPPAEEKPATREEILNQARKSRGQPTG